MEKGEDCHLVPAAQRSGEGKHPSQATLRLQGDRRLGVCGVGALGVGSLLRLTVDLRQPGLGLSPSFNFYYKNFQTHTKLEDARNFYLCVQFQTINILPDLFPLSPHSVFPCSILNQFEDITLHLNTSLCIYTKIWIFLPQ